MRTILQTIGSPVNVITELITNESDIDSIANKYKDKQDWFFVAPIAWAYNGSLAIWEKIAQNNTLVAAQDKELAYPWSLSNVIVANDDNISITMLNGNGDQELSVTGSSVESCYKIIEKMKQYQ